LLDPDRAARIRATGIAGAIVRSRFIPAEYDFRRTRRPPREDSAPGRHTQPALESAPMTDWYFVWVEGLRGPMPQKWSSDGLWGQVGRQDVIVRFTLSDEEKHLPLDELARRHPIPGAK
jgi:hypothetical protein